MNEGARRHRLPRRVPFQHWPEPDRSAWRCARRETAPLEDPNLAAHWVDPTAAKVEDAAARFLGWTIDEAALQGSSIAELATPENLRGYISFLDARVASITSLGMVVDLGEYLRVAWRKGDWRHLRNASTSLRWRAKPTRDKRSRLKPSYDLFNLGQALMSSHDVSNGGSPRMGLARYRDGLAIALLALRPLRIRAFGSLRLGAHLRREGERWRMLVPPELMKTARSYEADLPTALTATFERYLNEVRPALTALRGRWHSDPGDALWVSIDGSPMRPKALGEAITKRTEEAFGRSVSPHFFRDCAATTLALESPEDVRLATPLLGHASPKTTEAHYNQASSVAAGRKMNDALQDLRRRR